MFTGSGGRDKRLLYASTTSAKLASSSALLSCLSTSSSSCIIRLVCCKRVSLTFSTSSSSLSASTSPSRAGQTTSASSSPEPLMLLFVSRSDETMPGGCLSAGGVAHLMRRRGRISSAEEGAEEGLTICCLATGDALMTSRRGEGSFFATLAPDAADTKAGRGLSSAGLLLGGKARGVSPGLILSLGTEGAFARRGWGLMTRGECSGVGVWPTNGVALCPDCTLAKGCSLTIGCLTPEATSTLLRTGTTPEGFTANPESTLCLTTAAALTLSELCLANIPLFKSSCFRLRRVFFSSSNSLNALSTRSFSSTALRSSALTAGDGVLTGDGLGIRRGTVVASWTKVASRFLMNGSSRRSAIRGLLSGVLCSMLRSMSRSS
mmetsp:Transcript_4072/g.6302  ORF Transcript_4072/g.6302 Transcript_4072/m.6302 type:complete len:378 (-) Transcript_4072:817-1950(-)